MKPSILLASLLASTVLAGCLALPALAQTTPANPPVAAATPQTPAATPPSAAPAPAPDRVLADQTRERRATADRDAMFEAHLAALHAGLTLTPDQDKMWPSVEQAMRGLRTMRMDMSEQRQAMAKDGDKSDTDPMEALKVYSDRLLERGQALKTLSDAASPLYASLTDDQKHRLPVLLRGLTPERGPLARMIERLGDEGHGADAAMADEPRGHHHRWDREGGNWEGRGWDRRAEADDEGGHWRHHRHWDDRGEDDDHAVN